MFSLDGLLIGLVMITLGSLAVKYTYAMVGFTGRQDWIECYTGSGTTYLAFKLFGVIVVIMGLLIATGFGDNLLEWVFSPLAGVFSGVGGAPTESPVAQ